MHQFFSARRKYFVIQVFHIWKWIRLTCKRKRRLSEVEFTDPAWMSKQFFETSVGDAEMTDILTHMLSKRVNPRPQSPSRIQLCSYIAYPRFISIIEKIRKKDHFCVSFDPFWRHYFQGFFVLSFQTSQIDYSIQLFLRYLMSKKIHLAAIAMIIKLTFGMFKVC